MKQIERKLSVTTSSQFTFNCNSKTIKKWERRSKLHLKKNKNKLVCSVRSGSSWVTIQWPGKMRKLPFFVTKILQPYSGSTLLKECTATRNNFLYKFTQYSQGMQLGALYNTCVSVIYETRSQILLWPYCCVSATFKKSVWNWGIPPNTKLNWLHINTISMLIKSGKCFIYVHIHTFHCKSGNVNMFVTWEHIVPASSKICCGTYIYYN